MEALLHQRLSYILVVMWVNLNMIWIVVHIWIGDHSSWVFCKESKNDEQECSQESSSHTNFNKSERKTSFWHVIAVYAWHIHNISLEPDTNCHKDSNRQVNFWLLLKST